MTTRVALTFDDGPSRWTEPLLEQLSAFGARATFFVLGSHIEGREPILRRAVADGHELGLHGWAHRPVSQLSRAQLRSEIRACREALTESCGVEPTLWRSPWHSTPESAARVIEAEGLSIVGADLDVCDTDIDERQILDRALKGLREGVIVGLHDGVAPNGFNPDGTRIPTVRAVAELLMYCKSVTVTEL